MSQYQWITSLDQSSHSTFCQNTSSANWTECTCSICQQPAYMLSARSKTLTTTAKSRSSHSHLNTQSRVGCWLYWPVWNNDSRHEEWK